MDANLLEQMFKRGGGDLQQKMAEALGSGRLPHDPRTQLPGSRKGKPQPTSSSDTIRTPILPELGANGLENLLSGDGVGDMFSQLMNGGGLDALMSSMGGPKGGIQNLMNKVGVSGAGLPNIASLLGNSMPKNMDKMLDLLSISVEEDTSPQITYGPSVAEGTDYKGWNIVYLDYINSNNTIAKGRRISKEYAIPDPTEEEALLAATSMGYPCLLEKKRYPRNITKMTRRLRVKLPDTTSKKNFLQNLSLQILCARES